MIRNLSTHSFPRQPALSAIVTIAMAFCILPTSHAAEVISDGTDGAFNPQGSLYTLTLPADGLFNFTTINIPSGVTVKFNRNAANTPVYFGATGDVVINGVLDISATSTNMIIPAPAYPKRTSGPGGYHGGSGAPGTPTAVGSSGGGAGGGGEGYSAGGAGNATPGEQATRYGNRQGYAGPAVDFTQPLGGGSGGGGGSAVNWFGWYAGGFGGGGGGAIQISTPGDLIINGEILANGANGGWAQASVFAHGGAGGGGSGGNIELYGDRILLDDDGIIQALGGYGGGLSLQPYNIDPAAYSSGANGGMGFLWLEGNTLDLRGTIDAVVIPIPAAVWLFGSSLLGLIGIAKKR